MYADRVMNNYQRKFNYNDLPRSDLNIRNTDDESQRPNDQYAQNAYREDERNDTYTNLINFAITQTGTNYTLFADDTCPDISTIDNNVKRINPYIETELPYSIHMRWANGAILRNQMIFRKRKHI